MQCSTLAWILDQKQTTPMSSASTQMDLSDTQVSSWIWLICLKESRIYSGGPDLKPSPVKSLILGKTLSQQGLLSFCPLWHSRIFLPVCLSQRYICTHQDKTPDSMQWTALLWKSYLNRHSWFFNLWPFGATGSVLLAAVPPFTYKIFLRKQLTTHQILAGHQSCNV